MAEPAMSSSERKLSATRIDLPSPNSKPKREAKPFFNPWRLAFLFVLILATVVYLPSLNGVKIWDDDALLDGSGIGGGLTLSSVLTKPFLGAYFRPLVSLTFFIENRLWYGTPFYYHQTNILIHVFTCAALMGLVLAAFGRRRLALVSGALFAVQPAQVSTVAWIGGRTDSLCSLLVVCFAYALLLGIRTTGWKRIAWIAASVLAFFLGALTKEQVIGLIPLVPLMLVAFAPPGEKKDFRASVLLSAPYIAAAVGFIALWAANYPTPFSPVGRGFGAQMMLAGQTALYYSLLFIAPSGKWMHTLSLGSFQAGGLLVAGLGLLLFLALLVGVIATWKRNPKIGWFAVLVALALLPISNLVPLPSLLVAPYRAGIAGLGVAVLLAWFFCNLASEKLAKGLGAIFLLWCTWLTAWGVRQWNDPVTVFEKITAEDPTSIVARRNISSYLLKNGKAQESKTQMMQILTMLYRNEAWKNPQTAYDQFMNDAELRRRIIENQGNTVKPEGWLGELFAQLGFSQNQTHDDAASRRAFDAALRIDPANPRARVGQTRWDYFDKNYAGAEQNMRIAIAVRPSDPAYHRLLAQILTAENKLDLANATYRKSIEIEPWFGPAYQDLAEVQVKQGDTAGALETLKSALNCRVRDEDGIKARISQLETHKNAP